MSSVFAQLGSEITIEPSVGAMLYDEDFVYKKSTVYGLALSTSVINRISSGLSYKTATSSTTINIPGNTSIQNIRWHLIQIQLAYQLINFLNVIELSPAVGVGGIYFKTPSLLIDLSALGSSEIPSRSSTHFAYSASLNLGIHLIDRISLIVVPGVLYFKNSEQYFSNYFIDGGFKIAIR
jgi:hypothetical protein